MTELYSEKRELYFGVILTSLIIHTLYKTTGMNFSKSFGYYTIMDKKNSLFYVKINTVEIENE